MTNVPRLVEDARTVLRETVEHGAGPHGWHALEAMAWAGEDPARAVEHLTAPLGPWDHFGALAATAYLSVHHRVPGGIQDRLAAGYRDLTEHRRSVPVDPALPPSPEVAAASAIVRADRDLAEIGLLLGHNPEPFEAWAQAGAASVDRHLWAESAGTYADPAGPPDPLLGAAVLFASIPDRSRAERVAAALRTGRPFPAPPPRPGRLLASLLALDGLRRYGFEPDAAALGAAMAAMLAEGLSSDDPGLRRVCAVAAVLAFEGAAG